MIPLSHRRAAERRLLEAKIAATPNPARFRTHSLDVLLVDPAKAREMKIAGYGANWAGDCWVALPVGEKPPESEKELIDIQDFSGATHTYMISIVTPLLGDGCYRLSVRARNTRPGRGAAAGS